MTYANQNDLLELLPLTVRVPPAYTGLMRAYANYVRAQVTWDIAYTERIETVEQENVLRETATRNMRALPTPIALSERQAAATAGKSVIDKLVAGLLTAAHAHYMEMRNITEQLDWVHDRNSLDTASLMAKRVANVYMCGALLDYEEALNESGTHGMWIPEYRLPSPAIVTVAK